MERLLVVVVEDDRAIRDVLTEIFRGEGYAVEAIGDGPSAFAEILRIRGTKGAIAAITLDLTLPGKDGSTILKELKADPRTRRVPVIVISATTHLLSAEARPLASAVIRKPFDIMRLIDTVAGLVKRPVPSALPFPPATLVNRYKEA